LSELRDEASGIEFRIGEQGVIEPACMFIGLKLPPHVLPVDGAKRALAALS